MALPKFIRDYALSVQVQQAPSDIIVPLTGSALLTITPPFTLEFDINKDYLSSSSTATFRLYNLNALHRSQIRRNINDVLDIRQVSLKAGYVNSKIGRAHV